MKRGKQATESAARDNRLFSLAALILVALAAAAVYSNTFKVPFHFDDVYAIQSKPVIRDLGNFANLEQIFKRRAIPRLTFAVNYRLGEFDVFGYHLVNLIIHVMNGWIVYFLALSLLRRSRMPDKHCLAAALVSALIFTCHPVQTQSVTYISQRLTSLASLFYLAAVLLYIRGREAQRKHVRPQGRELLKTSSSAHKAASITMTFNRTAATILRFVPATLCAVLAMCSKENAASLPGALVLTEFLLYERTRLAWKRKLPWLIFGVLIWGIIVLAVLGFSAQRTPAGSLAEGMVSLSREPGTVGRWQYLCTQFTVLWTYFRLLTLPVNQCVDYFYPFADGFTHWPAPLSFIMLLTLLATALRLGKNHPLAAFGVLWILVTISVESSVIPIKDAMAEHRLYLPLFGFSLLAPYLLFTLFGRKRVTAITISLLLIVLLGVAAYARNTVYRDAVTLWSDVTGKRPDNPRAHYNLGHSLHLAGRLEEAIAHYQQTVDMQPSHRAAHGNMGIAYQTLKRYDEAIAAHRRAADVGSNLPTTHFNLGTALDEAGYREEAVAAYREAIRLKPDYTDAHFNCGNSYADLRMTPEAQACYERAARFAYREKRYEQAILFAERAREMGAGLDQIFLNLLDRHRLPDRHRQQQPAER